MKLLITICGRGGSKGVQNKNIREFIGKPLIFYTISAAFLFQERRRDDQVDICVNSDSDELLRVAGWSGAVCIKRPEAFALDTSPKVYAIRHSLEHMEAKFGGQYDYVIDLDITSPLRRVGDIENALNTIIENKEADVVFSVVPSRRNPYFNMVEKRDGKVRKIMDVSFMARQQAPTVYDLNASIYCYKRSCLLDPLRQSPLDGVFDVFLMKDTAVLDIDSEEDFELLEMLTRYHFGEEYKEVLECPGPYR